MMQWPGPAFLTTAGNRIICGISAISTIVVYGCTLPSMQYLSELISHVYG